MIYVRYISDLSDISDIWYIIVYIMIYIYTHTHTHTLRTVSYINIYIYIHNCIDAYVYIVYIYTCIYMYIYMVSYINIYLEPHMNIVDTFLYLDPQMDSTLSTREKRCWHIVKWNSFWSPKVDPVMRRLRRRVIQPPFMLRTAMSLQHDQVYAVAETRYWRVTKCMTPSA